MLSLIPSIAALGLVALAALLLSLTRKSSDHRATECIDASRVLAITTAVQAVHFAEELATDFHIRFPALFGLEPMPLSFFVAFNLLWILAWVTSVPLLRAGRPIAFFAAWFLALAGMLNGIAHPLMAAVSGGYFPGLVSAPFIGIASVLLWQRLRRATK
jgi:hypothetical protein